MEPRKIANKAALAVLGLALLCALWSRVRAAQGLAGAGGRAGAWNRTPARSWAKDIRVEAGALEASDTMSLQAAAAPAAPVQTTVPSDIPRKIVRNASLTFEVKDYAAARGEALGIASRLGAEVSQDESAESGGCKSGILAFRAAPEKLDALLKQLEPLGRVLSRSVSTQNMTEEYVDLKARIENLRKVERRLTELLSFKTHKLPDVLQVERELERVGSEIERLLGRMKYIDSLAANSILTLNLSEPLRETSRAPGILTQSLNSVRRACNTFLTTGLALLDLTGFLLAVGLWAAPIGGLVWATRRKMASKNE